MQNLNPKQKVVYDHRMKGMYDDSKPINIFITGGAGVGKSLLMRALHNGFTRFYVRQPNNSPDLIKVLNLIQLVTKSTTIFRSLIDHIWITQSNQNTSSDVRTTYYTDHMPLLLDIN